MNQSNNPNGLSTEEILEIIEKAMKKAEKAGWLIHSISKNGIYNIIFGKDFAKALWPSRKPVLATVRLQYEWEKHLQQMVIADDPIKYLGENI